METHPWQSLPHSYLRKLLNILYSNIHTTNPRVLCLCGCRTVLCSAVNAMRAETSLIHICCPDSEHVVNKCTSVKEGRKECMDRLTRVSPTRW